MYPAYRALLLLHVAFAVVGLIAFWIPIFARKGGRTHVRAGRVFLYSAYVVAATAFAVVVLSLISPFGTHPEARPANSGEVAAALADLRVIEFFLGYLAVITFASVYHGVRAMQAGREPARLREPLHTGAAALSILASLGVVYVGLTSGHSARWIFLALSPIGLLIGIGALRYARRPAVSRMAHWYEHIGAMLGGGIAFHTAFAVFGIQRFIDYSLDGLIGILPWVLPAMIGVPATAIWTRHYRRKFGEDGQKSAPARAVGERP